ncbi:MAG TPA: UvrD-helicase domain-containing protein [Caldisericia bacterium]|mgnify:FL=1|nr:UvrD-helicase domain-containing protein [Caldisericia bacterium]
MSYIKDIINKDLSENQKKAVLHIEGPLLVFAGAGSGKTKTLTYRVAYLIEELKVKPDNILAVTFTNKASEEMKERIKNLLNKDINLFWIGTFHSMCSRILRKEIVYLGYNKNFTILDEDDSLKIIDEAIKNLDFQKNYFQSREIYNKISYIKSRGLFVEDYIPKDGYDEALKKIFLKYEEIKKNGNLVDFDDLINFVTKILNQNDIISRFYSEKFKFILVDEYQDINPAQHKLLKALTKYNKNIFVVGDDDQSIYKFRGSSSELMLSFKDDFEKVEVVYLSENYRSTETIVNASKFLIKNNKTREEKPLYAIKSGGDKIKLYRAINEIDEARFVIKKIIELKETGIDFSQIAILYRTNAQSRTFEEAAILFSIPYRLVGGIKFYQRKEIKDLLSYLRIVLNERDFLSLEKVFNFPKIGVGEKTFDKIKFYLEIEKSLIDSLEKILEITKNKKVNNSITKFIENYKKWKNLQDDIFELINSIISDVQFLENIEEEKKENIYEFLNIVKEFNDRTGSTRLEDFLSYISLISDVDTIDTSDKITLMTVHSAKGLEFNTVFIVGLEEGLFPHFKSLLSNEDIEEERRLLYVAMTRAKENLYLTYSMRRTRMGVPEFLDPSRFLNEIPEEFIDKITTDLKEESKIINEEQSFKNEENLYVNYKVGEKIYHDEFGYGKIIEIVKDRLNPYLVINFGNEGIKKISLKYSKIKRGEI